MAVLVIAMVATVAALDWRGRSASGHDGRIRRRLLAPPRTWSRIMNCYDLIYGPGYGPRSGPEWHRGRGNLSLSTDDVNGLPGATARGKAQSAIQGQRRQAKDGGTIEAVMLFLDRWPSARARVETEAAPTLIECQHRIIPIVSLATVFGTVAGSDGPLSIRSAMSADLAPIASKRGDLRNDRDYTAAVASRMLATASRTHDNSPCT